MPAVSWQFRVLYLSLFVLVVVFMTVAATFSMRLDDVASAVLFCGVAVVATCAGVLTGDL